MSTLLMPMACNRPTTKFALLIGLYIKSSGLAVGPKPGKLIRMTRTPPSDNGGAR